MVSFSCLADFVAADMPNANRLTVGIIATVPIRELDRIVERLFPSAISRHAAA